MDLVVGTAQIGLNNYGISNVNIDETSRTNVLKEITKSKIKFLDISNAYGQALSEVKKIQKPKFDLIMKFTLPDKEEIFNYLKNLIDDFSVSSLLFHRYEDLISSKELWHILYSKKTQLGIKKLGVSLYNYSELSNLLSHKIIPDVIEIPYNFIDREFEPYFKEIKNKNIEIIVRSIFLQGILIKNEKRLPNKLLCFSTIVKKINQISLKHNISPNKLLFDFVKQNPHIDKVVIGIENEIQLKENIKAFNEIPNINALNDLMELKFPLNKKYKKINNWKKL